MSYTVRGRLRPMSTLRRQIQLHQQALRPSRARPAPSSTETVLLPVPPLPEQIITHCALMEAPSAAQHRDTILSTL